MDKVAAYGEILDVPVMDVEAILSENTSKSELKRGDFFAYFC